MTFPRSLIKYTFITFAWLEGRMCSAPKVSTETKFGIEMKTIKKISEGNGQSFVTGYLIRGAKYLRARLFLFFFCSSFNCMYKFCAMAVLC